MNFRLIVLFALLFVMAGAWLAAFVIYRAAEVGELVSPLAPRHFEQLTVVAAGTGSSYENPERLGPVTAVGFGDRVVLVDAGRGVGEALRRAGISPSQPRLLLLTNVMPVNTVGLDDLLFVGWLRDRDTPLRVVGPRGTAALVDALQRAHRTGTDALGSALPLVAEGGRIEGLEVDDGWREEIDGVEIRARALPGGPVPALAWRFTRGRRSLVISGTGWSPDALVEIAQGADMLVHEAVYIPPEADLEDAGVIADPERLRREAAIHTSLLDVGALATRAGVGSLVLVRLFPPPFFAIQVRSVVSGSFDGDIRVPEDGDELTP